MNRKEAAELSPFIKAFGEGKDIEMRSKNPHAQLNGWAKMDEFIFGNFEYRIKPEVKFRPFANAEECWQEMQKHQPFGWLKSSEGYYFQIVSMGKTFIGGTVDSSGRIVPNSYRCLYNSYTFTDGLPFGVKVEE